MSMGVVGIAAILVLLPLLAVACGGAATPTPTQSPTVTPTPLPTGNIQEEPPEGWVASQNLEHGFRFWHPEGWEQYSPEGIDEEVEFFTGFRDSTDRDVEVWEDRNGDVAVGILEERNQIILSTSGSAGVRDTIRTLDRGSGSCLKTRTRT